MISLEEAGVEFESRLVAHRAGEHKNKSYLQLNPSGKVPALVAEGRALAENVAIISYLSKRFPEARLLPRTTDPFEAASFLSDLSFCASVLHPLVTRIRIPSKFCDLPDTSENVWRLAATEMKFHFQRIEDRLAGAGPWWYGERWSALDAYLFWVWFRVTGAGFPTLHYPAFSKHADLMALRPSTQRTLAREEIAETELKSRGLELTFKNIVKPSLLTL